MEPAGHALAKPGGKGQRPAEASRHARPVGRRRGQSDGHVPRTHRGGRLGHGVARHGERSGAVAAAGSVDRGDAAARRGEPQCPVGLAQRLLGPRARRAAPRHPEGRPFRHRGAGAGPERDHEPSRRLPLGNPADGNAADEGGRHDPQRPRHGRRAGSHPCRSHRHSQQRQGRRPLEAGANPRRRHLLSLPLPRPGAETRPQRRRRQRPRGRRGEQALPLLPKRH